MPKSAGRRLLAATGVVAAGLALSGQAPPSGAAAVLADVEVTRNGRPVAGLTAADFVVRDSGVAQQAELVPTGRLPVNLLLVLDTSASLRGPALERLKEAAGAALARLRPADEAALLTFGHSITLGAGWTDSRDLLTRAIAGLTAQGSTALHDAAFVSLGVRSRPGARTLVLLFTDGDDSASWLPASDIVEVARRSEAVVYGVTLVASGQAAAAMTAALEAARAGSDATLAEIQRWLADEPGLYRAAMVPLVAFETGGDSLQVTDASRLPAAFGEIVARFSGRYVLRYTPSGVAAGGWHPLEIEVRGGGRIQAKRGYVSR